ncbi:MAG: SGNH/GDSL hydrolase family protein [Abditibacteriota bacterium]|nr:SGNH/GDSL hydrolase family protein [Abditibacteriota bacterium]
MIKVVLLGDSIRQNYGPMTVEKLGASYSVWQPEDNCRFIKYTQRGVFYDWRESIEGCDIVHFNCGLWDTCDLCGDGPFSDIDEYTAQLVRTARQLQKMSKKVIFASTTPVRPGQEHNTNERITAYNKAAVGALEQIGVLINDLWTPVYADLEGCIRADDLIHLTEKGIDICSELVAGAVRRAASDLA